MKDSIARKTGKRMGSQELAELMLESDPNASMETIGNVISEWGELMDDRAPAAQGSTGAEAMHSNNPHRRGNL